MKKLILFITMLCLSFTLAACGGENDDKGKLENTDSSKILIAYFSATGTTEGVAEKIAEVTGGTLYEITPASPYTQADLNYSNSNSRTAEEDDNPAARPEIDGTVENMSGYEVIYLGYPIWYGKAPKIIYTFLESYDFSDKTIVPFCTSASSGMGNSANNLHALADGATWLNGIRFSSASSVSDVRNWIESLNG